MTHRQYPAQAARYESFRDDLVLMYFPRIDVDTGELRALQMTPLQIHQMRLVRTSAHDCDSLCDRLASVSRDFGCDVTVAADRRSLIVEPLPSPS
jgi:poly-gamma-glutamate capsule biosynthesis protein CapA/YwtB (metallophosphatase superfamily)